MKDIEDRLQGKYQKSKGLPLSIEGHVHALINVCLRVVLLCNSIIIITILNCIGGYIH